MSQTSSLRKRGYGRPLSTIALGTVLSILGLQTVFAFVRGEKGSMPITDPDWPVGAPEVFNNPARIAWWEGPPFGGGQYHAEYRGNSTALNAVLMDFVKIDVKTKRIVVRKGIGYSFWLDPNQQKQPGTEMDWSCMFWNAKRWEQAKNLPSIVNDIDPKDVEAGPPAELVIYTGGSIKWSEVKIPEGISVVDERSPAQASKNKVSKPTKK